MDGNRRTIKRLRQVYQRYDQPELVDDYVSKGGHAYRPMGAWSSWTGSSVLMKRDKRP